MAKAKVLRDGSRLDADLVVRTALEIARTDGIGAISMRTVADRLGVTPMALYYHVKTKDLLVKLVADAVVATVDPPDPGSDWRTTLIQSLSNYRRTVANYPGLAAVLLHGGLLPHSRRLVSAQLDLLESAGFSPEDARRTYAAFHLLVLGRLTVDEARRTRTTRGPSHEKDPQIDSYLEDLQGDEAFDEATLVLLAGMEAAKMGRRGSKRRLGHTRALS